MSLAVYVLTGIRRSSVGRAPRPSFKYFLLGAFSSAFFLYGIAFTYARRRASTRLEQVAAAIAGQVDRPEHPGAARRRPAARRLRVQGVGRAVPHVDARRLRGRADARHGRSCRPASRRRRSPRSCACSCRPSSRCSGELGPAALWAGGRDDDRRHGRRRRADQRQAHARVLEHRARRVPARRPDRRPTRRARPPSSSTWRRTP